MGWNGWPIERSLILFVGLAFALMSIQVTLFHYRGNFRHWVMYGPVIASPLLAVLGILLAFYHNPTLIWIFGVFLASEALAGIAGFTLHSRGVALRVGGFGMNNVLTGPPVVLPLMLSALSTLGLLALYWGR